LVLVALVLGTKQYNLRRTPSVLFEEFINDNNVFFASEAERLQKFETFKNNIDDIKDLNNKYPGTRFGLNKFALLSKEEFKKQYLTSINPLKSESAPVAPLYSEDQLLDIPDEFDWRDNKPAVVTPVKDQGMCGSCWAFSTTGNVEGQWALAGNNLVSLSEQNLVDCDHHCTTFENEEACDAGCDGGLPPNAYMYIMENGGINTEKGYPYQGSDNTCRFKTSDIGAKVHNWTFVSDDEAQIAKYLVDHGPLSVAVDATVWQFYVGGVLYIPCGSELDHAVLITGYGVETNIFFQKMPYWTVKNSWGTWWGSSGYIYVQRGTGKCAINTYVTTAIIKNGTNVN